MQSHFVKSANSLYNLLLVLGTIQSFLSVGQGSFQTLALGRPETDSFSVYVMLDWVRSWPALLLAVHRALGLCAPIPFLDTTSPLFLTLLFVTENLLEQPKGLPVPQLL